MNNSFIHQKAGQKTTGWLNSFFLALILIALQGLIYQNHYPDILTQQKVFSSLQIKELLNSDFLYEALWFIAVLVTLHWLIVRLSLRSEERRVGKECVACGDADRVAENVLTENSAF